MPEDERVRSKLVERIETVLRRRPALVLLAGEAGIGKTWLVARLGAQPGLRVVEDIEADENTLAPALRELAGDAEAALLVTYRPEELAVGRLAALLAQVRAPVTVTELTVPPLTEAEVAALAAGRLGAPVVAEVATLLHGDTGGIARAVEEAVDLLAAEPDDLARLDAGRAAALLVDSPVPPVTRYGVRARLLRLSPAARSLVEIAAVAGGDVDEAILSGLTCLDVDALATALAEAVAAGALIEAAAGRAYRTPYPMAGRAVYDSVAGPLRRRLHLRIVESLAAGVEPLPHHRIAEQYRRAGRVDDWRVHTEAAAEQATATGDVGTAVRLLRSLLIQSGLPAAELTRIGVKFGSAAVHVAGASRVLAILRELVEDKAIPAGTRGELRLNLGLLMANQAGDAEAGDAEMIRALADLGHRPDLRARAMSALALPGVSGRPLEDNLAWLGRVEEIRPDVTDPVMATAVDVNIAGTLMAVGDSRAWRMTRIIFEDRASAEERIQLRRGCLNLSDGAIWLGHYRRTRRFVARSRELVDGDDASVYADYGLTAMELILDWLTGRWDGLEERAESFGRTDDVPRLAKEATFVSGALSLARGRSEPAARLLGSVSGDTIHGVSPPVVATATALLARFRLERGEVAAAARLIDRGLSAVRTKQMWLWGAEIMPVAAALFAATGREAVGADLLAEFDAGTSGRDAPSSAAASAWARAALTRDPAEAAARFRTAQRRYAQLSRPYDHARARVEVGRARLADGDRGGTEDLLAAASALDELGATGDASAVRALLRTAGVEPPRRARRRGYGSTLSPREAEVARLVAAGETNAAIAAALYLSPRTVEQHVAHALRKLRLRSRRDLIGRSTL